MFSLIKDRKHIEQNFHSVAGIMRQGWDLGVLGVKNFSVGICDGAPSTAHSSLQFCNSAIPFLQFQQFSTLIIVKFQHDCKYSMQIPM